MRYRLISVTAIGLAIAAWLLASFTGKLDPNKVPPAQVWWGTLADLLANGYASKPFWQQVLASLGRMLSGFTVAVLIKR